MTATESKLQTLAILQARVSSSRLPGKVLMQLGGVPMICFMIERLQRATNIDRLVLATSTEASDEPLAEVVAAMGVPVVRGPLDDVLARFALAVESYPAETIVRLTGDCPLIDPGVVDKVAACIRSGGAHYASNCFPPTYPDGLDCEAFTAALLHRAVAEATLPSEREHVTPWIRNAAGDARQNIALSADLSGLRWTVDYQDDLDHVRQMVDRLGGTAREADLFDMLRMHEDVNAAPTRHRRNEGYDLSLTKDSDATD